MVKAGLACAAIVALLVSASAAEAGTCYDPWSMGGSTPTVGPVCGEILAQGGNETGNATPYGIPSQNGGSVSLLGGAGGPGMGGLVAVSGSYGAAHITATSHLDADPGDYASMYTRGQFGFLDRFHVVGPDPVTALFTSTLEGSFFGGGEGESVFRIQDLTNATFVIYSLAASAWELRSSDTKTATGYFVPGHEYIMSYSMQAEAHAVVDPWTNRPDSVADLGNTGHLYVDIVNGGALAFQSGHNYATNAIATTPIPAALPLFASALAGMGFIGWRRKRGTAAVAA